MAMFLYKGDKTNDNNHSFAGAILSEGCAVVIRPRIYLQKLERC